MTKNQVDFRFTKQDKIDIERPFSVCVMTAYGVFPVFQSCSTELERFVSRSMNHGV